MPVGTPETPGAVVVGTPETPGAVVVGTPGRPAELFRATTPATLMEPILAREMTRAKTTAERTILEEG